MVPGGYRELGIVLDVVRFDWLVSRSVSQGGDVGDVNGDVLAYLDLHQNQRVPWNPGLSRLATSVSKILDSPLANHAQKPFFERPCLHL